MPTLNPYKVLGVTDKAGEDEIKRAYKTMALKWHPDRHQNDKERATKNFVEVNNAYRMLVQEGRVREGPGEPVAAIRIQGETSPPAAPSLQPQMTATTATSLDSVVHILASSVESLSTLPSSFERSRSSSWKRDSGTVYEATVPRPHVSPYPSSDFHRFIPRNDDLRGVKSSTTAPRPTRVASRPPHISSRIPVGASRPTPAATRVTRTSSRPNTAAPRPGPNAPRSRRDVPDPLGGPNFEFPTLPKQPTPNSTKPRSRREPYSNSIPRAAPPQDVNINHFGLHHSTPYPPYGLPLKSIGLGTSQEWVYALTLGLEELFTGKHCCFGITRHLISGKTKEVVIELDVPPGCRSGTKILCRGVGHERRDGTLQDIAFIIEEAPHDRFTRHLDDLVVDVRIPWPDVLRLGGNIPVEGLDGQRLFICIDCARGRVTKGRHIIPGGGMPVRQGGNIVGRGNLIVPWEIIPGQTKVVHLMKRFFPFKR